MTLLYNNQPVTLSFTQDAKSLSFSGGSDVTVQTVTGVASDVSFTPDGDIVATNVQDAIVEVRDDTDTKLSTKSDVWHTHIAGQITDFDTAVSSNAQVVDNKNDIATNAIDIWNNTTAIADNVIVINTKLSEVSSDASLSGLGTVGSPLSVRYGKDRVSVADLSVTSTTSNVIWSSKWAMTVTGVTDTYELTYTGQANMTVLNQRIEVRLMVNWVQQGDLKLDIEPKDALNRYPISISQDVVANNGDVIELEFKKSGGAGIASVRDVNWFINRI